MTPCLLVAKFLDVDRATFPLKVLQFFSQFSIFLFRCRWFVLLGCLLTRHFGSAFLSCPLLFMESCEVCLMGTEGARSKKGVAAAAGTVLQTIKEKGRISQPTYHFSCPSCCFGGRKMSFRSWRKFWTSSSAVSQEHIKRQPPLPMKV